MLGRGQHVKLDASVIVCLSAIGIRDNNVNVFEWAIHEIRDHYDEGSQTSRCPGARVPESTGPAECQIGGSAGRGGLANRDRLGGGDKWNGAG